MSANIALDRNGNAMIASYREMPWHRQGTVFQDRLNGPEMLKVAGLDWQVRSCPLFGNTQTEKGEIQTQVENMQGIYRSDTGAILGISSERYNIFQNSEMIEVIDAISSECIYEVAGGLGKGERVWVLANIPDLDFNVKGDAMKQYLTILSSHDGSSALTIMPTTIRIVCNNTYTQALRKNKDDVKTHGKNTVKGGFKVRHTSNMKEMVADVISAYKETVEAHKFSREMYEYLANTPSTPSIKDEFFNFILDGGKDEKEMADAIRSKRGQIIRDGRKEDLEKLLVSPTNQTLATGGTLFGLYNTVTEWVDHDSPTRKTNGKSEDEARFESSQFGNGANLKDAAFDKILELAGV